MMMKMQMKKKQLLKNLVDIQELTVEAEESDHENTSPEETAENSLRKKHLRQAVLS
jgi:hypothetical protein